MNRRGFLVGLLAAPFVVPSGVLMPLRGIILPPPAPIIRHFSMSFLREAYLFNGPSAEETAAFDAAHLRKMRELPYGSKLIKTVFDHSIRHDLPGAPIQISRYVTIAVA